MKIKKFNARNFTEALELVKKELSEDAIILSTEEKKGIRPFVEVTAAVDYDMNQSKYKTDMSAITVPLTPRRTSSKGNHPPISPLSKGGIKGGFKEGEEGCSGERPLTYDPSIDAIKSEIGNLRETIESMKNNGYEMSLPAKKRMVLHFLRERAVLEEFALRLCEKARDLNDIVSLISADIKVKQPNMDRKAVMLIGPTGVGKTTTIAKLSAKAIKQGRRVAIINLDTYRIGAVEQIRIYAGIMGIPLSIASNGTELKDSLLKFAKTRDIIFIDTTGRNPRDDTYMDDMVEICHHAWAESSSCRTLPIELHLLMSASCDDAFMIEAYRFYRRLPINYIAFTKVDEAVRFGSLYNLLLTYQKPVAYITTGQRVPGDINFANQNRLADLILTKGVFNAKENVTTQVHSSRVHG